MQNTVKVAGRIALGLAIAALLLIAGLAALIAWDVNAGASSAAASNSSFQGDEGVALNAYIARPEGQGPFPAVIMVHEWWGLTPEITEMAELLAAEGYYVIVPDTYRGPLAQTVPGALYLRINVDEARVDKDMRSAYDYLISQPEVDPQRIGVMGFCYGGGVALRFATQEANIRATINPYGDVITDPAAFGALLEPGAGPVLGIFGDADQNIPLEEVEAFEAALSAAGIAHSVNLYADMPHAFIQPDSIGEPGEPQRAWQDILAFLDEYVKGG